MTETHRGKIWLLSGLLVFAAGCYAIRQRPSQAAVSQSSASTVGPDLAEGGRSRVLSARLKALETGTDYGLTLDTNQHP